MSDLSIKYYWVGNSYTKSLFTKKRRTGEVPTRLAPENHQLYGFSHAFNQPTTELIAQVSVRRVLYVYQIEIAVYDTRLLVAALTVPPEPVMKLTVDYAKTYYQLGILGKGLNERYDSQWLTPQNWPRYQQLIEQAPAIVDEINKLGDQLPS
jgi:hypothetical protein